jgi:hypothetical protein
MIDCRSVRVLSLAFFTGSLVLLGGCPQSPAPATPSVSLPARPADQTYTVRAEVVELPSSKPGSQFRAHHEAIDNFVGRSGKVEGMSAMVMDFPPAPGVDVSSLRIGDKVELSFSVWWIDGVPEWFATKVVKLPPETKLEYRAAKKPTPAPADSPK